MTDLATTGRDLSRALSSIADTFNAVSIDASTAGAVRSVRDQIAGLAVEYQNYSHGATYAELAARAGRSAWWSTSQYHDAITGIIRDNVNLGMPLDDALALWADGHVPDAEPSAVLSRLIPLNGRAEIEKSGALAAARWREAALVRLIVEDGK